MTNNKFGVGDIVKIRNEENLAVVVMPIEDEDQWYYEVKPLNFDSVHREVKESDLAIYKG